MIRAKLPYLKDFYFGVTLGILCISLEGISKVTANRSTEPLPPSLQTAAFEWP